MSAPHIPRRTKEESIADLLQSVALEEASLAHIINAEAEKIQESLREFCPEETLQIQESVREVFNKALKMQILLQFKLEEIRELKEKECQEDGGDSKTNKK